MKKTLAILLAVILTIMACAVSVNPMMMKARRQMRMSQAKNHYGLGKIEKSLDF